MKKQNRDTSPYVPQRDKYKGPLDLKALPWTNRQKEFFDIALAKPTRLMFVNGPAGSTKTILATYVALELVKTQRVSDVLYIRSAVESADAKLGYLPGEVDDKISFYGEPFMDKLNELLPHQQVKALKDDSRYHVMPVNYTRGLNWNAKVVIIDEAQNLTYKELVTVLTRIAKYSRCFVLADPDQSDINGKSGGFQAMYDMFSDDEAKASGVHTFKLEESDIMRDELTRFLVKRFKAFKSPTKH